MISVLLLPLFLSGTQANIGGTPSDDPAIRLWINNDGRFLPGDHAQVQVRTRDDGYLLVLHADPDGQLRVLFPLDPGDDNFVRGGERYEVKGRGGREAFDIDGTWGRGMVYAAVSRDRFRFDGYRLGDQWDYSALAPSQLPREPEPELTDLVLRMAPGDFDYDVTTYDVIERVVYASDYWSVATLFAFDPVFCWPCFPHPVLVDRFFHWPFFVRPGALAPVPFRDRRDDFRPAVNTAQLTPWRARGAAAASRGRRVEFRGEGPSRPTVADARQRAIEERRDNWPVDVSPRRREPVTDAGGTIGRWT